MHLPALLELLARHRDVSDRQVIPIHMALDDFGTELRHPERLDLVLLDETYHGHGAPLTDGIEINREIALPGAAHRADLLFARTEGDTDPPVGGCGSNAGDLQRM